MILIIALLFSASLLLLGMALAPSLVDKARQWQKKKEVFLEKELDKTFYSKSPKELLRLYFILPPVFGVVVFLLLNSAILAAAGAVLGLFVPTIILRIRDSRHKQKFNTQLLDAIMILASCLKGGLSLLQALEILIEEIPAPMSQEMGLVVRENKMGVPLEESLVHLNERIGSEELGLVINSILVARETGGDLTKVLSRLTTTIRDNRKLTDSIKTLTMQGKMQGIIMSFLPFGFIWWVVTFNREHFDIMLNTEKGRMLLFVAVVLQIIGMFLIKKFSTIKL
ncbi:MAG: type II secretion system F family protein [Candidatus Omnitrophica bacterium]|nr:type II secretion system F family protein [Candidatus Omnitrophota bacterium]